MAIGYTTQNYGKQSPCKGRGKAMSSHHFNTQNVLKPHIAVHWLVLPHCGLGFVFTSHNLLGPGFLFLVIAGMFRDMLFMGQYRVYFAYRS